MVNKIDDLDEELKVYQKILEENGTSHSSITPAWTEQLMTAPLISWPVRELTRFGPPTSPSSDPDPYPAGARFDQYAVLGRELPLRKKVSAVAGSNGPIFLNTNSPWSAFVCGSQGSGKSHTLSCMLENCLIQSNRIGRNPYPLAAILFYYDPHASPHAVCEAAHLASHIPITVLVSPSNLPKMKERYSQIPYATGDIDVRPLLLKNKHLNTQRMLGLMAVADKDASMPLYMEVVVRILREMAMESDGASGLNYRDFLRRLDKESFSKDQRGPMQLRLQLLESFMESGMKAYKNIRNSKDIFEAEPGKITIVDLTDPFVDAGGACALFDICLALFLEDGNRCGRVVALDEAHKFMNQSAAADRFSQSLLGTIREQRHRGARLIIATQEPTISTDLLDLCTVTLVHRFTSPAWLTVLRKHLAGAASSLGEQKDGCDHLFHDVINLNLGDALLFSPLATLCAKDGTAVKLGAEYTRIKIRQRLTADGGRSVMAIRAVAEET